MIHSRIFLQLVTWFLVYASINSLRVPIPVPDKGRIILCATEQCFNAVLREIEEKRVLVEQVAALQQQVAALQGRRLAEGSAEASSDTVAQEEVRRERRSTRANAGGGKTARV